MQFIWVALKGCCFFLLFLFIYLFFLKGKHVNKTFFLASVFVNIIEKIMNLYESDVSLIKITNVIKLRKMM